MSTKPASRKVETDDDDESQAPPVVPLSRTPCDVRMSTDFEIGGGSFNRLTNVLNQSEIDEATGIIYFNFKGKKRRMSIHSAAVGAVTDV